MATDEERLVVLLEARIRDFEKNMQKAERSGTNSYQRLKRDSNSATQAMEKDMVRSTDRINQALATTSTRVGAFGANFIKGLAVGAIAAAMAQISSSITETIRGIAEMGDQARRSGMDATSFQEWKFVAEQNRIGVDSLVDGFKELSLRADEFIATGTGSGAEAFKRLGLSASELATKLQDPSALMLEIVGRMEDLDKAAQIRVADEIFGGTGGERFVELLAQGEDGLRKTVARAHELGVVMNDEAIAKAAELDRKFSEVTATLGAMWKTGVVGAAEFVASMAEVEDAASRLGNAAAPGESAADAAALGDALSDVRLEAEGAAHSLQMAAQEMEYLGNGDAAAAMATLGREMTELIAQYDAGQISAETFTLSVESIGNQAVATAGELERVDKVTFSGVIERLGGLGTALQGAIGLANALTAALPGNQPDAAPPMVDTEDPRSHHPQGGLYAPETSPRPQAPGFDALGDWEARRDAAMKAQNAAGGGGRGGGKKDRYEADLERLTEALQTERETLDEWYAQGQEILADRRAAEIMGEEEHAAAKLALEQSYQEQLLAIREAGNQWSLQSTLGGAADILGAMGAFNKKALKIAQVASTAQALISTYEGAAAELRKGTFGFASAAAVIAKGLGFVAAIKGAAGGGGGGGSSSSGGFGSRDTASAPQAAEPPPRRLVIQGVKLTDIFTGEMLFEMLGEEAQARGIEFLR
ncbi:hypothetical protein FAZ78_00330 [Cereibacter changlensis]|uniref:Tail tape measure protein n=1 Tax=Cereibacter changlensis TaxID=402884 RepID=A0A4U0Z530_9RHOB|nr:hypothetical protein [Cereibacter changlensis]TKA98539.1 hypothetical protein FAZ78_00330 [Cereibacter changlensis]